MPPANGGRPEKSVVVAIVLGLIGAGAIGSAGPARADDRPPSLAELLRSAKAHNRAVGISLAQLAQQEAAVHQSLSSLTPTIQVDGGYTRNQYAANLTLPSSILGGPAGATTEVVLQPYNLWAVNAGVVLPVLNLPGLYRYEGAKYAREAARQAELASEADVLLATAQAYYQVLGAQGVVDAAETAAVTAKDNLQVTEARFTAGTANRLSVERARADLAHARQTLVAAEQVLALAVRNLETLSGLKTSGKFPAPDEPAPVAGTEDDFVRAAERRRPELAELRATTRQQELSADEAWAGLAPSVSAAALGHYTSAGGFAGHETFWTAGATFTWTLDPVGTPASIRRARAATEEQRQRWLKALDEVRDEVHASWIAVGATRARLEQAAAEAKSSDEALAITRVQYREGAATSYEVSQAQRDAFNAQATLAQARADLAAAVLSLKKAAGESLLAEATP